MERDDKFADGRAQHDVRFSARKSGTALEAGEALDLYVRQIARNLTDLEEQVLRLREACGEYERLLRKVE